MDQQNTNGWMNEWINEWMNERMNECINESMNINTLYVNKNMYNKNNM
jgi:nitrogen fixation/metabolism regulation signal transduction histidine kinase